MRNPLDGVGFERLLALLPILAAVGLAATLCVTIAVGERSRKELALLRDGYEVALEASREFENQLQRYQTSLQNAVAASDLSTLSTADSLVAGLLAGIEAARSNPVLTGAELDELQGRIVAYHETARRAAAALIADAPADSLQGALASLLGEYRSLRDDLQLRTERERERIAEAHSRLQALNRHATLAIVLALAIAVAGLTLVARSIERQMRTALVTIARAASHIGNGDLRRGIDFGAQVELAVLAKPFRAICDYIEGIAAAADRLAKGDMGVSITPRSDRDVIAVNLRQAIVDRIFMEEALRQNEEHRQAHKMEAIGRLAGGIAHDFNNLLTAIQGHTALLSESLGPEHEGQEELAEVRRSAERAAALTRQLLAYSSKQVLHPKLVDLNAVVRDVSRMLRRMIREDVELLQELAPRLGAVRIDPTQLEQVIVNLVVNARDAMPNGGTVTLRTSAVTLEGTTARRANLPPGPYVVLRVEDTGVGMDEATRERIFEPFFTTRKEVGGTGLGLATVYGIIRQSGGDVRVDSAPGHGTTFEIHLPAELEVLADAPAAAGSTEARGGAGGSELVLVVEDELPVRRMIVKVLTQRGYRVLQAGNGIEAQEIAAGHEEAIDVLLTDVVMPQMGGRELAEALTGCRPGLRVVYMSGYSEDAVLHREVFMPGVRFLEKPFTPHALADKIREVLDSPVPPGALELATSS